MEFSATGVILGLRFLEMRNKVAQRVRIRARASNTNWVMEYRILTVTTHALLESAPWYRLATSGARANLQELGRLDALLINRAARMLVGANITMRLETVLALVGMSSMLYQYISESANALSIFRYISVYFGYCDLEEQGLEVMRIKECAEGSNCRNDTYRATGLDGRLSRRVRPCRRQQRDRGENALRAICFPRPRAPNGNRL